MEIPDQATRFLYLLAKAGIFLLRDDYSQKDPIKINMQYQL